MPRFPFLAAAFLLSAPALAAPAPPWTDASFVQGGQHYLVEQSRGDGVLRLRGRVAESGEAFVLAIRGRHVTGWMANRPVAFDLGASASEIAAR